MRFRGAACPVVLWLALAGSGGPGMATAADPSPAAQVEAIRAQYQRSEKAIAAKELHRMVIEMNPDLLPAPAVGTWHKKISFFFAWPTGPSGSLVRANIDAEISAPTYHEEYLFEDLGEEGGQGKLIFAFLQGGYEERERRFYFAGGKLVRVVVGTRAVDAPDAALLKEGLGIQKQADQVLGAFQALQSLSP